MDLMLDGAPIAIIGAILTFIAALVSSLLAWRRNKTDDMAQFRADLFKMNESLKDELSDLRDRIRDLEREVYEKSLTILDLETLIAKIRRVILDKFGEDVDDLLENDPHVPK